MTKQVASRNTLARTFSLVASWAKTHTRVVNVILLVMSFVVMVLAYFYLTPQVTGDEPHYLIADHAMAKYHTFDLKTTYSNEEYLSYYPGRGLLPQGDPTLISLDMPHTYPMHGIGLSLFTLPGYILGGKNGVVVQMILLATAILALTWLWCRRVTKKITTAYVATGALFISYFFIGLSGYIYPDMLIAAILLSCLLLVSSPKYSSRLNQTAIGLLLGFGIFLHYRNIVITLPVLLWLSYLTWKNQRKLPWITIALTSVLTGLFMYSLYKWFGVLNPAAPYGTLTTISTQPHINIVAMLFDSSRGLFVYNPILMLIAVGLPIWYKLHRHSLIVTAIIAGPTIGMLAFFSQWTGGAAPTGRYIVAFLPVLIPAIALVFEYLTAWWQRTVFAALGAVTLAITIDAVLAKFTFVPYHTYKGTSGLIEQLRSTFGFDMEKILPSFTNLNTELIGRSGALRLAFWVALLAGLVWYGYYVSKKIPVKSAVHVKHTKKGTR